jgi:hypothetical protein
MVLRLSCEMSPEAGVWLFKWYKPGDQIDLLETIREADFGFERRVSRPAVHRRITFERRRRVDITAWIVRIQVPVLRKS